MRKRSVMSVILCAAMAGTMLAGCGNSAGNAAATTTAAKEAGEEKTTAESSAADTTEEAGKSIVTAPTELTYIFADGDEGAKAAMNEIVKRFNDTYSDITVKIEPGNGGAYNEFLKTKESVGEFPDIMEMRDTAVYERAGMLAALPDDITSLFKSTMQFDGATYTAPLAGENTNGIIYNKKYFDDNGLQEPKTYDEFIALCKTIKEKGDMAPLVVGGQDIWHMGFWFNKAYNDQVMSQDPDFIKHCYDGSKNFPILPLRQPLKSSRKSCSMPRMGGYPLPMPRSPHS